ncbi:Uma2 family endonuclease [Spirulina sp. CCNP1310]|uniref:Uma2 family endonuclease n=1 Tax=Spirulina sp. CCNP1310 TaxID=3110249 RepID=UPI002B1FB100|nr:Uma2 family endonuclease [Spirulina sp. CCNP1310]MEA5419117.1 Uma2 family endonuclease [Spirulina sp. CCNP1310]
MAYPSRPSEVLAAPHPCDVPLPPDDLIFDDGEPLESNRHRIAMNVLIETIHQAWRDRTNYFVGGNMFIYYSRTQARNRDFRGPDFFVVLDVDGSEPRQGWVVWEEEGRYPDVIIELMSPSTAAVDLGEKKHLYAHTFHTRNYFVYDPFDPQSLQGWQLTTQGDYEPLTPNDQGWLWSSGLELWLGHWQGELYRETAIWLRFYDSEGNLMPLSAEAEREQLLLERERSAAERERAEAAQAQAEAERERAEVERERAERLAAHLRSLGIDPDQL